MADDHRDLGKNGRKLWDEVTESYELNLSQQSLLLEACRCRDQLDKLDAVLRGDIGTWLEIEMPRDDRGVDIVPIIIDKAVGSANQTRTQFKAYMATLGLTDPVTGVRRTGNTGQGQGAARGAYGKATSKPKKKPEPTGAVAGSVTSIDRGQRKSS